MGRLRVRSLFVQTPTDEPSRGSDSSANDSGFTHSAGSSGSTSRTTTGVAAAATAPPAAADTNAGADAISPIPYFRALNPTGVLRKLRRGSVRHSSSQSASDSASVSYQLPPSTDEASRSQKSIDYDSSSSSTAPTVGITGLPELDPVLRFLQNHSTRVYREGFLLQLDDLDINGNPCIKRDWTHYFARLTGTVLSFWRASDETDSIDETRQSPALYMNIADASLKVIDSLPTDGANPALRNILSISTAGRNRFLLHFNSVNTLTQWTAAIRLAIFEYALLQESYTGALIAGKGKYINGLRQVLGAPTKFAHAEWARVRFRPGTPWVRCWCVIEPPSEKETAKLRKNYKKQQRQSVYDHVGSEMPRASGCVCFYKDEKASKKAPIARITDAWMAYAVYPRGMELIDHSTLLKVHGMIEAPASAEDILLQDGKKGKGGTPLQIATEGSVFILPESRPAVAGYDVLIRFLIPFYDAFSMYGRPTRLIADTSNTRSLMFALGCNRPTPAEERMNSSSTIAQMYTRKYLDILDVSPLIHTRGSQSWSEQEWMRNLKNLTAKKMTLKPTATMPYRSASNNWVSSNPASTTAAAAAAAAAATTPPSLTVGFSDQEVPSRNNTPKPPHAVPRRLAPRQNTFRSISESLSSPTASGIQGYNPVDGGGGGDIQNEHDSSRTGTFGHGLGVGSVNDGSLSVSSSSHREGSASGSGSINHYRPGENGTIDSCSIDDRMRKFSTAGSSSNKEPSIHSFQTATTTTRTRTAEAKPEDPFYTPGKIAYQQSPLGRNSPVYNHHHHDQQQRQYAAESPPPLKSENSYIDHPELHDQRDQPRTGSYTRERRRSRDQQSTASSSSEQQQQQQQNVGGGIGVHLTSSASNSYGQKDSDATLAPEYDYFSSGGVGGGDGKIGQIGTATTTATATGGDGSPFKPHNVLNNRFMAYEQSPSVPS